MADALTQIKQPQQPEQKLNRAGRRAQARGIHHNVYTKKYKSKEARETAWKNFLGKDEYAKAQKQLREFKRKLKEKKQTDKLKKSGVIIDVKAL